MTNARCVIALAEAMIWLGEQVEINFEWLNQSDLKNVGGIKRAEPLSHASRDQKHLANDCEYVLRRVVSALYASSIEDYQQRLRHRKSKKRQLSVLWPKGEINMFTDGLLFEAVALLKKIAAPNGPSPLTTQMSRNVKTCAELSLDVLQNFQGGVVKPESEVAHAIGTLGKALQSKPQEWGWRGF